MARFGDRGPYAVGNVKIITAAANKAETDWTVEIRVKRSAHAKQQHAEGNFGTNAWTAESRANVVFSAEARAKISAALSRRVISAATRAKRSVNAKRQHKEHNEARLKEISSIKFVEAAS
jgi:hypothetical protein